MPQSSPNLDALQLHDPPALRRATMLLAFTGWMDGGDVSTGTVQRLIEQVEAREVGFIDPEDFYIYHMPGSMEIATLFRPHTRVKRGILRKIEMPENTFHVSPEPELVLFTGQEPNLRWGVFGDCIFAAAERLSVRRIVFVGSFAGSVPHTREPRLYATVSDRAMLPALRRSGVRPSDYDGPGSFAGYLMSQARHRGIEMISLVAEIPAYIQGANPLSIEAVTRRLAAILELPADLAELRSVSDAWENQVTQAVDKDDELAEKIRELETQYDDDLVKFESDADDG